MLRVISDHVDLAVGRVTWRWHL